MRSCFLEYFRIAVAENVRTCIDRICRASARRADRNAGTKEETEHKKGIKARKNAANSLTKRRPSTGKIEALKDSKSSEKSKQSSI